MSNTRRILLLSVLAVTAGAVVVCAQNAHISVPVPPAPAAPGAPKPAPAPLSATEQFIKDVKAPVSWFSWGADLRVRNEYYNTIVTLNEHSPRSEQDVIRYRGRFWTSLTPVTNVSVNARIAAEPRQWYRPSFVGAFAGQQGMEWRYGMVDNLNLKWNNILDQPVSLTAGRQDIVIGDFWNWWLVADGTPLDGSWTYFLDSARLTFELKDIKTKFDVIGIYQNAYTDEWLPVVNNQRAPLTEQNEKGLVLYAYNKSLKNVQLDGFFIYKHDERELANGDDADIYTLGARATGFAGDQWSYSVEGAYQFGKKQDPMVVRPVVATQNRDISAFGVNGRLTYLFKDKLNNQANLVYEYLSGDDGNTPGTDEMFDVLWGRWPRWSELYIYSYLLENGGKIAQLNNVQRLGGGWTLNPMKGMGLGVYYTALFAPEKVPTRAAVARTEFSNTGNFRGHYLQTVLKHAFSKRVNGHLWGEFIWEGDYYAQRDLLTFLRAEIAVSF